MHILHFRSARALAVFAASAMNLAAVAHNHVTVDTASGAAGDQIRIRAGYYPTENQFSVTGGRLNFAGAPAVYLLADTLTQPGPQANWFVADDILLTSDFYAATGRLNGGDFRWEIASVTTLSGAAASMAWGTWDASMTTFTAEALSDASTRAGRSYDTFWAGHDHDQAYAFSAAGTYDVTFVVWDGNGKFADSAPLTVRFEVVPAPGAVTVLALAGLRSARRRRA